MYTYLSAMRVTVYIRKQDAKVWRGHKALAKKRGMSVMAHLMHPETDRLGVLPLIVPRVWMTAAQIRARMVK